MVMIIIIIVLLTVVNNKRTNRVNCMIYLLVDVEMDYCFSGYYTTVVVDLSIGSVLALPPVAWFKLVGVGTSRCGGGSISRSKQSSTELLFLLMSLLPF